MSGDHNMYASGSGDGQRKQTIQEMAREAGFQWDLIDEGEGQIWYITQAGLEAFAKLVREDEREACALLCERLWPDADSSGHEWSDGWADGTCASADAIRARGEQA